MSEAYRRLTSHLPDRHVASENAFAAEPRAVKAWIDALPMANFAVASRRVLDALRDLNRQRVDGVQRLDALELLRRPLAELAAYTDRQILGASFPLPAAKAELGELALAFQGELATGYRIALAELCAPAGGVPFLRGRHVALAALRALQHGGAHLAKAYLLYRTPAAGAWRALHDVHRFAAELRLDDRAAEPGATPRAAYLEALLVALANPYRFTQREQGEVAAFARALVPYAELRDRNGGERDLAVPYDADRGPGYLADERGDARRGAPALHLDGVHARVDAQLAAAAGAATATLRLSDGAAEIDAALARRVAAGWRARAERGHPRLGGGYVLDSVLGLHELHSALAGGEEFASFLRRVRGEAISLGGGEHAAAWRGAAEVGRAPRRPVRVLDQSLGGYRVLWERAPSGDGLRVRVADLVGLALPARSELGDADWMSGAVRWLRIDEQGGIDAGIELLARRALAAAARRSGDARTPVRALLLASTAADPGFDYSELLVPAELERGADEVELVAPVDLHGVPAPARAERVQGLRHLETIGLYERFALAAAGGDGAGAA